MAVLATEVTLKQIEELLENEQSLLDSMEIEDIGQQFVEDGKTYNVLPFLPA